MNKTIWTLWFQGWDNAPEVSKKCLQSWKYHNPTWDIKELNLNNLSEYIDISKEIPELNLSKINKLCYSDIVRLFLLKNYGGVWVDSTTFCNKPLDDWIPEQTYLFKNPYDDFRMVSSWFISSGEEGKRSYIINKWYETMIKYWKDRISNNDTSRFEGCWVHRLFGVCHNSDNLFREIWDSYPKMGCKYRYSRGIGPHFFVPYEKYFHEMLDNDIKDIIDSKVHPVYKLNHKVSMSLDNTSIGYLFKTIGD